MSGCITNNDYPRRHTGFIGEAEGMLNLIHTGVRMLPKDKKEYVIDFANMYKVIPQYLADELIKKAKIEYDYDIRLLVHSTFRVTNF